MYEGDKRVAFGPDIETYGEDFYLDLLS